MKKILIIILSLFTLLSVIFSIKYLYLKKTKEVPYCNLTRFSTAYYYIYSNISYKKNRYSIVCGNDKLYDLLSRNKNAIFKFGPIYGLWMSKVIKNNISIEVNDEMFSELEYAIIKDEFIQKHKKNNTIDSILISKGNFPENLIRDDVNAIVYLLLKSGVNCRNVCETGDIEVILPPAISVAKSKKVFPILGKHRQSKALVKHHLKQA